jgi:acyl-homoserine lactone acylase PvdQ
MRYLFLLFFFPVVSFSQTFTAQETKRYQSQARDVTIIRDNWGIPHIYGKTDADAVFGLMYAQCEENFYQLEENNIEMLGRLSELHGLGELYNDLQTKLIYDTAAAIADYQKSPAWLKKLLDASADGVNFYLYRHPEVKPKLLQRFEPWFALLRTDGSIGATQTGGLTMRDMREMYPVKTGATSFVEKELPFYEVDPSGSNGFAVGPFKTKSGNAILYINPHTSFYYRTEVHLVSEEGLNAYGAVTWGTFFIYQGFNESCGWMHTSSYADVADLFEEKVVDKGGLFYEYDKKLMPIKSKTVLVNYREGAKLQQEKFITYETIHGPVLGKRNGKWLSLKENNRSMESLIQSWLRTRAHGFEEYKKIMDMRVNNSNNTVFADNKGNIAYWHGNFMPKRSAEFDYSLPVDGSTSASNWKGLHPLGETVHVYNPQSGWIQNCNSTPFTVSGKNSPVKTDYPEYMAPDGENYRAINAARLLSSVNDITIDKMIDSIGYNRYLSAFEVLQPPLLRAFDSISLTDSLRELLSEPLQMVRDWDRIPTKNSIAAALAIEWGYRILRNASSPSSPYRSTDALGQMQSAINNTGARQMVQLFYETLMDIEHRFGTWRTPWGEINRYQRTNSGEFDDAKPSLPVGMAAATFGSLPSFSTRRFSNTDRRYGVSGNSFIACVEFGKKVKAKTVITGGQSFDPKSPNYSDQAQMYIDGIFKDVFFYKEDVLKNARRQYHPGE